MFDDDEYTGPDWKTVNARLVELDKKNQLMDEYPESRYEEMAQMRARWGEEYADEELYILEELYQGILHTYNVIGKLQVDQAKKVCRISLTVDQYVREGKDPKNWIAAYSKVIADAGFIPKNIQNGADFDSVGELYAYLEKTGWTNPYYDGEPKDSVDLCMENIQKYNRDLYINEEGIAEDIERRINLLQTAEQINSENLYGADEIDFESDSDDELEEEFIDDID